MALKDISRNSTVHMKLYTDTVILSTQQSLQVIREAILKPPIVYTTSGDVVMSLQNTEDTPVGTGVLLEPEFTEECVEEQVEYEEDFFGDSEPPVKRKKSSYSFPISEASAQAIYNKCGSLV